jgi:hypothetical protein
MVEMVFFAEDITLRRNEDISGPNTSFDLQGEWTPFPANTYDGIGSFNSTLSIENETLLEAFRMYPNPVKGNTLFFTTHKEASVQIYNVLGKLIKTASISENNKEIDLSNLSKGIYLVKIQMDTKFITKKLIKK